MSAAAALGPELIDKDLLSKMLTIIPELSHHVGTLFNLQNGYFDIGFPYFNGITNFLIFLYSHKIVMTNILNKTLSTSETNQIHYNY